MPMRSGSASELPQPTASAAPQASTASALARIAHDPDGAVTDRDRLWTRIHAYDAYDAAGRRVHACDGVVDRPGHPHAAGADCDTSSPAADRDALHDPVGPR